MRLICRRERPHPGAQLSSPIWTGHRFQCFITDKQGDDLSALEHAHRQHAQVDDRVKTLKATGAEHLPFHAVAADAAWLELAICAHDLTVWSQQLTLDGEHDICEPKRLRYRILNVAGHLTRHARPQHAPPPCRLAVGRGSCAFKRLQALSAHG